MKRVIALIIFLFAVLPVCLSQDAQTYFNAAGNHYIAGNNTKAVQSVNDGLKKYPGDAKLRALADKLKEEKKQQDKKDQEQKDKEKKEQEKKEQEKKEQEKKEQEKKDQEKKDKEKKDQEKKDDKDKQKDDKDSKEEKEKQEKEKQEQQDKEDQDKKNDQKNFDQKKIPDISPEKAHMILEAMKNQEKQYLQQNKRKATKPKDRTKPDW